MPEWVIQLVVAPIIVGVITSFLFLMIISRFRPNIQISKNIARGKSTEQVGKHYYVVKITNKSKRSAVDVKVRFSRVQEKNVPDGTIMRTKNFELEKDSQFEIPGFDKNDPEESAFRFFTYDDIQKDGKGSLIFVVYAKDSLSGFGKVFTQEYFFKDDPIKNGSFKKESMEIT